MLTTPTMAGDARDGGATPLLLLKRSTSSRAPCGYAGAKGHVVLPDHAIPNTMPYYAIPCTNVLLAGQIFFRRTRLSTSKHYDSHAHYRFPFSSRCLLIFAPADATVDPRETVASSHSHTCRRRHRQALDKLCFSKVRAAFHCPRDWKEVSSGKATRAITQVLFV